MSTIKRLFCALFGHKYFVDQIFNRHSRKVGCARCNGRWAMNDQTRSFLEWDSDLEELHQFLGELK